MKAFDALVRNAFGFLNRSVDEVEASPQYSIIHLAIALELFLKARLAAEHWTLVFQDPGQADQASLETGSFQSVSITDAVPRIEKVLGERLAEKQKRAFRQVRDHRNRLVHAYHPRFTGIITADAVQQAVAEQALSWYYLSGLLREQWSEIFQDYRAQIDGFEAKLHEKGHLLRGRYEDLRPELEKQEAGGTTFHPCLVCQHKAAREKSLVGELVELKCLVCGDVTEVLKLSCQTCDGLVLFEDDRGICQDENCGATVSIQDVIDYYSPGGHKEDFLLGLPAICGQCEYYLESVVPWGDEFLCIACFDRTDGVSVCEYCATAMTGETEGTYAFGCTMCEGSIGADRS